MFRSVLLAAAIGLLLAGAGAPASAESTYVKFLKSGRVPPERMGAVLGLLAKNGDAEDLAYVLQQATKKDGFPAEVKPLALEALLEAANTRNVKPTGDLGVFKELLGDHDNKQAAARVMALKLVGQWRVEAVTPEIEQILADKATSRELRQQALKTLAQIGGKAAETTFAKLAAKGNPTDARILAVAGLAQIDAAKAAPAAVAVFADLTSEDNPAPLIDAFLASKNGPAELAKAVGKAKLPVDAAKLALRHMYSVGRADEDLVTVFSAAAGISTESKPLTPDELKALTAEATAKGNAQRGELLFRRADLSCMKCHALSGGGGNVGPDLSPIGQTSPVDYVITSILTPELSVKEEFQLAKVLTSEGKLYVGIVAEDNADRIVLKDGEGKRITIPKDGEEEIIRGGSLMPKGLSNFLTHTEFLDLVKFVSELGKPGGAYPVRTQPTVQRWRLLVPTPEKPSRDIPNEQVFRDDILNSANWQPAYAKVAGQLPLAEMTKQAGTATVFLQAEINVTVAGNVEIDLAGAATGITLWLGEKPLVLSGDKASAPVEAGNHKLTLRVDTARLESPELKMLVHPGKESPAEYVVVGGP
jgi:putative heme-binding domain-containing protein